MKELAEALPWFSFWIFVAVFVWCDHKIYLAGHDSFMWEHKTDIEKEIQKTKINK